MVINEKSSCEYGKLPLSESLRLVELEVLEKYLSEFIHLVHVAKRPPVKEVIQVDIELILEKNRDKDLVETTESWAKVVKSTNRKYNGKGHRQEDTRPEISNRYNLLYNDSSYDDAPVITVRPSTRNLTHGRMD
jgi:hypothetical protein